MTMEFAYFPGCTACSTGLAYEMANQCMARALNLTFREIPDWNCCGASAAHLINRDLSLALPARSLALCEEQLPGLDVVAPCAACFSRLKTSQDYASKSPENRAHIESLIDREYRAEAQVFSILQAVAENDDIRDAITKTMVRDLGGLKVASYYGCVLVRPEKIAQFDDTENPQSMDDIMRLVGAEPVDWSFKTECCGASLQVTEPSAGKIMVEKILRNARESGAEAIVTACPLCQLNLDMRQQEVNKQAGTDYDLPVYYFTQLIALCLGASPKDAGIHKHYYPATALAERAVQKQKASEDSEAQAADAAQTKKSSQKEKASGSHAPVQKEEVVAP